MKKFNLNCKRYSFDDFNIFLIKWSFSLFKKNQSIDYSLIQRNTTNIKHTSTISVNILNKATTHKILALKVRSCTLFSPKNVSNKKYSITTAQNIIKL